MIIKKYFHLPLIIQLFIMYTAAEVTDKNAALSLEAMGVNLNWTIRTVPDVGHSNAGMAKDAAKYLYDEN